MLGTIGPEVMTAEQRRNEVAGILGRGMLRGVRLRRMGEENPRKKKENLDLSPESRLSVAPRPVG